jgi:protein PhnA
MIETQIQERAASKCELCGSGQNLSVHDLRPGVPPSLETNVLLCETCNENLSAPLANPNHWFCLRDSMWSEHTAVKALAYRILKSMGDHSLAQELLGQIYLEPEVEEWAGAVSSSDDDSGSDAVVDSNGSVLEAGDTVTLIKDLEVKGANFTAKRGTTVKGISLTGDPRYVEGKVNGIRIVLVAAYLKKA